MAWVSQYVTNVAGGLNGFLDNIITNYGQDENGYGWNIYDSNAGTNIGVYQCQPDDNSSFILVVKDNQADCATIEYWEGWDATNHAGVGNSMTYGNNSSYTLRIRKATGLFNASINKRRIVLAVMVGGWTYYLGYPRRFDEAKDTPCFIGHDSASNGSYYAYNPLAGNCAAASSSVGLQWRWFKNSIGSLNQQLVVTGFISTGNYFPRFDTWTTTGQHYIFESTAQEDGSPYKLIGILDGVMCVGNCPSGRANGDTIVVGEDVWLAVLGSSSTTCFIKEA
jgi:hypothetical protein